MREHFFFLYLYLCLWQVMMTSLGQKSCSEWGSACVWVWVCTHVYTTVSLYDMHSCCWSRKMYTHTHTHALSPPAETVSAMRLLILRFLPMSHKLNITIYYLLVSFGATMACQWALYPFQAHYLKVECDNPGADSWIPGLFFPLLHFYFFFLFPPIQVAKKHKYKLHTDLCKALLVSFGFVLFFSPFEWLMCLSFVVSDDVMWRTNPPNSHAARREEKKTWHLFKFLSFHQFRLL